MLYIDPYLNEGKFIHNSFGSKFVSNCNSRNHLPPHQLPEDDSGARAPFQAQEVKEVIRTLVHSGDIREFESIELRSFAHSLPREAK